MSTSPTPLLPPISSRNCYSVLQYVNRLGLTCTVAVSTNLRQNQRAAGIQIVRHPRSEQDRSSSAGAGWRQDQGGGFLALPVLVHAARGGAHPAAKGPEGATEPEQAGPAGDHTGAAHPPPQGIVL